MTREDIIRIADEQRWKTATTILVIGTIDELKARVAALEAEVATEREACARMCDSFEKLHPIAGVASAAIRARGEER